MAMIGSAAFGCVVGWAACFAKGWRRPSVLLVRMLWLAVLVLLVLIEVSQHPLLLVAAAAAGGLGHLAFLLFIRQGARGLSL